MQLMDPDNISVTFLQFHLWWVDKKEQQRRLTRREVRDAFNKYDKDSSGQLDKAEFAKFATKCKGLLILSPEFEVCSANHTLASS